MAEALLTLGRFIVVTMLIVFGIQHVIYTGPGPSLAVGAPWVLGSVWAAWLAGAALIASGVGLAASRRVAWPSALVGAALWSYALLLYVPGLIGQPRDPLNWTRSSELIALGAVALILAGYARDGGERLIAIGRVVFAVCLAIWSIQHFMYARPLAALIPAWLPWRLFLAYFVGIAFIAAGVSISARVLTPAAATLLAIMFLLFVVVLHVPRVAGSPGNGKEWTNLAVALAMCGSSLVVAGVTPFRTSSRWSS